VASQEHATRQVVEDNIGGDAILGAAIYSADKGRAKVLLPFIIYGAQQF